LARQLFIRLEASDKARQPATEEGAAVRNYRAAWLVLENGRPVGNIMRGDLSSAIPLAGNAQVIVTIPTEEVLLLDVAVPGRNHKRLLNAVPYAVEDQLIDDVDKLHFALSKTTVEGKYSVAVIDHERMREWQTVLRTAGLQAHSLLPDALALPYKERAWCVFIDGERMLVRTGRYTGFASQAANLELLLKAALQETEKQPDYIELIVRPDDTRELPEQIGDITVVKDTYEQEAPALLACDYDETAAVNLLQGEYSRRENISKHVRPWYQAAALLLVWLVWQGGLNYYESIHLDRQIKALDKQMEQLYRSTFPAERKVIKPFDQMVGKLLELRKKSGKSTTGLHELLLAVAPVLGATKDLEMKAIRYHDGRMDLEFSVKDAPGLEDLKQRLSAKSDIKVEVQSASSRKDRLETRMLIKGQGS